MFYKLLLFTKSPEQWVLHLPMSAHLRCQQNAGQGPSAPGQAFCSGTDSRALFLLEELATAAGPGRAPIPSSHPA